MATRDFEGGIPVRNRIKVMAAIVAAGTYAILFSAHAHACSAPDVLALGGPTWSTPVLQQVDADMDAIGSQALPSEDLAVRANGPAIVGLWKFTFLSQGNPGIPDGAVIDAGFTTWHSDGTELMNSSRPPMTGSFCMGAWRQAGTTYRLNHFALSWDPSGTVFVGPANIREQLRVDRAGNSFMGSFTLDQFAADGITLLAHVVGTVTGQRITAD
jgi:hypothetical protein